MSEPVETYRGVMIHRDASPNPSGLHWWALCNGRDLRAQTLEGMRDLIRHYLNED